MINLSGLSDKEVIKNRELYGTNEISRKKKASFFSNFLSSLGDPIIKILLIALGIKLLFLIHDADWFETIGIFIAILIATLISSISEYGSEKSFLRLQEEASKIKCRVKRNNKIQEIGIDEVVKNDIILLQTGDRIPADGILIDGMISVDESSLNGETHEVYKHLQEKLYRGSVVCSNEALMLVLNVGENTIYGGLAKELQDEVRESPLKLRLRHLAKIISRFGYIGALLVSLSYLIKVFIIDNNILDLMVTNPQLIVEHLLYALTLAVTVIVVAVPEGLPMMITLVLSSNMKKMLKDNVLVRKLDGIETSGSLNILFTDKTGTITRGELEVTNIITGDNKNYKRVSDLKNNKLSKLIDISILFNNSASFFNEEIIGGNTTDRALLACSNNKDYKNIKKDDTVPFDSKNKFSVTKISGSQNLVLIKGAFEKILPYCTKYYNELGEKKTLINRIYLNNSIMTLSSKATRIIVLATSDKMIKNISDIKDLTLVAIIGIKDEVRSEAKSSIKQVVDAGIQVVMITGDSKETAYAIATEIDLLNGANERSIITSDELKYLSDDELKDRLPHLRVIARALPQDKSRLVRIAGEINLVVGMTGDGVNDAPALKKADVGFSMGSGTEVAKEAGDIVILDNNFLSITKTILYGRTIFKSIRKFIIFQLTVNICAVGLSIIGPFIGINAPVTVIQMLWINMVMDTFAALAFAKEAPIKDYMKESPKKRDEKVINRYMFNEIFVTGLYSLILCILFLKMPLFKEIFRTDVHQIYFMTAFFALFIFIGIFNSFNARTHRLNLFAHILKNKTFIFIMAFISIVQIILIYYGGSMFRTSGLTLGEFELVILIALTVIPFDLMRKCYLRVIKKEVGGL